MSLITVAGMTDAASRGRLGSWLGEADQIDQAVYTAVASAHTPKLDRAMRRVSNAADYSKLSITAGALLALAGGPRGRTAALNGWASVAATATIVNLLVKPVGQRRRPDRGKIPSDRQVRMPVSRSLPSGHTAAAVAFANGVGTVMPLTAAPLHTLAALVGYSRVHTGVHYPGDVVAGAVLGAIISGVTTGAIARRASSQRF